MATFKTRSKRLHVSDGRGSVTCQRTGFLYHPDDVITDHRGIVMGRDVADITPGFGTRHPQDVAAPRVGGDPSITRPVTPRETQFLTKQDLGISDAEIEASIREGRAPRPGH